MKIAVAYAIIALVPLAALGASLLVLGWRHTLLLLGILLATGIIGGGLGWAISVVGGVA